jgi:hypothetical protein
MEKMLHSLSKDSGAGPHTRSTAMVGFVCHDRATVHRAPCVNTVLTKHGVDQLLLPPRSPDLCPLDYGVFGAAKRWWAKQRDGQRWGWDDLCVGVVEYMRGMNTDAIVSRIVGRWERCVQAGGGHFEGM